MKVHYTTAIHLDEDGIINLKGFFQEGKNYMNIFAKWHVLKMILKGQLLEFDISPFRNSDSCFLHHWKMCITELLRWQL